MPSISLPLHSHRLRAAQASTSRLVNCHIEQLPPDAKTPAVLTRSPGITSWGTVGPSGATIEGMHADHVSLYVVSGGGFYTVTTGAVATLRGAVGSSTEIDMDSSATGVVIVSPPLAYSYTVSGASFAAISDADFTARGAGDVEHLDGYILFREPDTGRFFSSDLNSLTAYTSTMFATAEGSPDALVGMKVDHRQIFLAGEKTCELWENTGISGFPFERMINGFLEIGCVNGKTIAKLDNSVFWVASDYSVRRLDGFTPVRVSTHAIEQWLKTVTLASLRAYSYVFEGHHWYLLTAPEGAYQFDAVTQLWSQRESYGYSTWNWANPVEFNGKILVGSTTSNVIGELSSTTYDEVGGTMVMEATYQPIYMEGRRLFHDRLELIFERGRGLTSGQGVLAEVMLDASDDGGRTFWSAPNRSLGALGVYGHKCVWHGLGSSDNRVYRVRVSDPIHATLVDAVLDYRVGRA